MAGEQVQSTRTGWSTPLDRYRAYAVLVVAALLVAVLPGRGGDRDKVSLAPDAVAGPATTGGDGSPITAEAETTATTAPPEAGTSSAPAVRAGVTATTVAGARTATSTRAAGTPGGGAANAASAGTSYPGVGTPAALANPNCDAERKKIKFPSLWAAPCVAPWPKGADNGGATNPGVTADAIRIVVRLNPGGDSGGDEDAKKQITDSFKIFSSHHELWGRKIDIRFYKATGEDEIAQRADAVQAYNSIKPFIAISMYNVTGGSPYVWSAELAARGVIVWDPDTFWADAQAQPGFRWTYNEDDAIHSLLLGEWIGRRLQGQVAKWAGDPAIALKPRTFGMVYPDRWQKKLFDKEAGKYGVTLAEAVPYPQGFDVANAQERARTQIAKLKAKNVTTVIAVCDPIYTILLTRESTNQQWFPEWVNTGWFIQDLNLLSRIYDQQQWSHSFGIGFIPPLPAPEKEERYQLHVWQHGRPPDDAANHGTIYLFSRDIFPALQLAGPKLTPATFKAAMFSKPPAGGAWNDAVISTGTSYGKWDGRGWDDYSGWDAYNEMWWDPNTVGTDEVGLTAPGVYWRLNGGKQYTYGKAPTGEPAMFDKNGAVYTYNEIPANDRWPNYPCEGCH